jgi:hypothetical protein
LQAIGQERDKDVSFDPLIGLVVERLDCQIMRASRRVCQFNRKPNVPDGLIPFGQSQVWPFRKGLGRHRTRF